MKQLTLLILIIISLQLFSHENSQSRADIFKNELQANETLMQVIEDIDNRYRIQYEKINLEIRFHNSELTEIIQTKPFQEDKAKSILRKISDAQSLLKLHNIKHHMAIEKELDSFQRMKFNEFFSP